MRTKTGWEKSGGGTDLLDCFESPSECDQTEEGVYVQAQLCKRPSCARQDRDETVDACRLVKKLTVSLSVSDPLLGNEDGNTTYGEE